MGLAAGQARLLSITARKSDCEFQSMRLSHQKIAMARELADLSNEYQDSLQMTKLVYDYYGKGDTSMALSYSLLMSPSALNDYMPVILTDELGRVTLNSKLAAAARKAGIPQEGLGCLPSEVTRNLFIMGLAEQGTITTDMANKITGLPYNQAAGFGGGATVATVTEQGNYESFLNHLKEVGANINITLDKSWVPDGDNEMKLLGSQEVNVKDCKGGKNVTFSLANLLNGSEQASIYLWSKNDEDYVNQKMFENAQTNILPSLMDNMDKILTEVLGIDNFALGALAYARRMIEQTYIPTDNNTGNIITSSNNGDAFNWKGSNSGGFIGIGTNSNHGNAAAIEHIGWTSNSYKNAVVGWFEDKKSEARLDIGNMLNAYLTYFADYMNGTSKTDKYGMEVFYVNKGQIVEANRLANTNNTFEYVWKVGSDVSSDDLGQATFYDTLFNQICSKGWTENERIVENDYLREMLQNGMQFISKVKDDGYYYQGNYATDAYIKEIPDESLIAKAEAKYNTEKAKLNTKEETIDMKMKNLDTEISSLTTEYDTVKNIISKNVEKCFKRFNA